MNLLPSTSSELKSMNYTIQVCNSFCLFDNQYLAICATRTPCLNSFSISTTGSSHVKAVIQAQHARCGFSERLGVDFSGAQNKLSILIGSTDY